MGHDGDCKKLPDAHITATAIKAKLSVKCVAVAKNCQHYHKRVCGTIFGLLCCVKCGAVLESNPRRETGVCPLITAMASPVMPSRKFEEEKEREKREAQ